MNRDVAALWATALRSGEYAQASQQLVVRELSGWIGYCCLGVLCEKAVEAGVIESYDGDQGMIPLKVACWLAGIEEPELPEYDSVAHDAYKSAIDEAFNRTAVEYQEHDLGPVFDVRLLRWDFHQNVLASTMNDKEKASFEQIAEAIERTVKRP